ncbi:MAG: hypothetical protein K2G36_02435 [Ruminococcus sp.]|nr:hypothetical protein [Ruminococcus sp.]
MEILNKYNTDNNILFECIGITLKSDNDISYKLYNMKRSNISINDISLPDSVYEFIRKKESEKNEMKFFGFSERQDNTYSITFSVTDKFSLNEKHLEISGKIREIFKTKDFPLFQTGYLLNKSGVITESKYYYTLNQNKNNMTAHMKMKFVIDNKQKICSFIEENISGISAQTAERFMDVFVKYQFRPFMFGINETQETSENKLYFIFNKSEPLEIQKFLSLSLLKEIDIFDYISDCFEILYANNLFLKGFSLSYMYGKPVWRLYFYPKR